MKPVLIDPNSNPRLSTIFILETILRSLDRELQSEKPVDDFQCSQIKLAISMEICTQHRKFPEAVYSVDNVSLI
jgi:hypothetical protein